MKGDEGGGVLGYVWLVVRGEEGVRKDSVHMISHEMRREDDVGCIRLAMRGEEGAR